MLKLFILDSCPYCHKVMDYLDERNMKYEKINIENQTSEDILIRMGGKRQVPFLVDTDRNIQMYESNDIIEYLKTVC